MRSRTLFVLDTCRDELTNRVPHALLTPNFRSRCSMSTAASTESVNAKTSKKVEPGLIESALRSAAMKLHTKAQAPKEGQVEVVAPAKPYVPTIMDYLHFLVDSQHVYQAFEDVVNDDRFPELASLRNTGLERVGPLEVDITSITKEYNIDWPPVGQKGLEYAQEIRGMMLDGDVNVPEFICHFYNYYFAHTAGGRMIGKKMSALLLEGRTLEFYKWDGDLNQIKQQVKNNIEEIARSWSDTQQEACVGATASAFRGGGGLNAYLFGSTGH